MKELKYSALIGVFTLLATGISLAQVEKNKLILGLGYYNDNNQHTVFKSEYKGENRRKI